MFDVEKMIGYSFRDKSLLELALTHSSYSSKSYERLEFLGDAVLEFVTSEMLFLKTSYSEGELTNIRAGIVNGGNLSRIFDELDISTVVKLGKSVKSLSKSIKEDIIEAIIGAIYIDGGINEAKGFVQKHILIDTENIKPSFDYKTKLQELLQKNGPVKIEYVAKKLDNKIQVNLFIDGKLINSNCADNKRLASQLCAEKVFKKYSK